MPLVVFLTEHIQSSLIIQLHRGQHSNAVADLVVEQHSTITKVGIAPLPMLPEAQAEQPSAKHSTHLHHIGAAVASCATGSHSAENPNVPPQVLDGVVQLPVLLCHNMVPLVQMAVLLDLQRSDQPPESDQNGCYCCP